MWGRVPKGGSRQALDDAWRRGSRCKCHAKRYIPASRQRKAASGGAPRQGSAARKPSTTLEPADPEDLLRELNSGGTGWLKDEEEQDWGLDDVAEHARARQQQQLQRFGGALPGGGGGAATRGGGGGGGSGSSRRRGGDPVVETHGSPLESGLASISTDGDDDEGAHDRPGASITAAARGKGAGGGERNGAAAAGMGGRAAPAPAAKPSRTTIELEASYARRNPEIVEALRLRGVVVQVRQPAGGADDDDCGDNDGGRSVGDDLDLDPDFDKFRFSDEDDSLDLRLESDLASADGGGAAPGSSGQGAPPGSRGWYGSLAAAGFSVRTNAAGEVFLERTVRRKAADPSTGAASAKAAATRASTDRPSAAAATTTAVRKDAARGAATAPSTAAAPPPMAPALEPISGRPVIVAALQRLSNPQQVLDFLELSYPQWAANGYRLVDMRSGRPVAAPSPAEAAHCLRALAITARRAEIGGWRCLELAAGRQVQGLAEALRVTPPRLLPEQATPQLSAAYFDAARRFWLDPAVEPIIDEPRVGRARVAAAATTSAPAAGGAAGEGAPSRQGSAGAEAHGGTPPDAAAAVEKATAAAVDGTDEEYGFSTRNSASSDMVYDSLVAKYTVISKHKQLLDMARGGQQQPQQQQPQAGGQDPEANQQPQSKQRLLNGHAAHAATTAAAAAAAAAASRTGDKVMAALPAAPSGAVPPASAAATAAEAAAEAAARRAAKIECLVSALWGLSSLGGPPYFQAETEAAVTILVRCLAAATAGAAPAAAPAASGGLTGWQAGQVLWALGNSRHVTPRLADLETSILRSGGLSAMQPRDVTRVLWGFASMGHRPERLMLTIRPDWSWRERTAEAAEAVPERERSKAEGGCGRSRRGKGRGGGELRGDVRSFTPQQLAGAVWALAVMEQVDTVPFRSAWAQLLGRASEVPPAEPVLTQIWQANLAIHLESSSSAAAANTTNAGTGSVAAAAAAASPAAPQGRSGGGGAAKRGVPAEDLAAAGLAAAAAATGALDASAARSLLLRARDVFLAATSGLRRRVQSGYQRQMANTLTGLRLMHLLEDNSAGYAVDITLPQLRIALEADGPTHTSRTPGGAVLGATAMKRRHLQRLGWHVVNVTYKEWDKLTSESARRAFLQERINEAILSNVRLQDDD